MKTVHKRQFDPNGTGNKQSVQLPPGAKPVGFALQQDYSNMVPTVWYVHESAQVTVPMADWDQWELQVVGTGSQYDDDLDYLAGPFIYGAYVFHLVGRKIEREA